MSVRAADKSKPYIPLAGIAKDGYSNDQEATATCYCGAVQLAFVRPTQKLTLLTFLFQKANEPTNKRHSP